MGGRLAICAVLSALALLVAGCGGSNQTKAEAWADDVCSSVNTWADTVQQSKATLTDTGNLTVSSAKGALTDVEDATKTLADDLRNVGAPETDASTEAQQQITQLSDELDTQARVIQTAVNTPTDSLPALLGQVSTITTALSAMGTAAQTAYDNLRSLNGGELKDAFESEDSCKQARSTLTDLRSSLGSG